MSSSVCVVGSVALDSIETQKASAMDVLGGSCSYFSVAASYFAPINMVGVIGSDFPGEERAFLDAWRTLVATEGAVLFSPIQVCVSGRR